MTTQDLHLQRLNSLCRVCGQRSLKRNNTINILCKLYASGLKTFHDIDIQHDDLSEKSETLCKKCYMHLVYLKVPANVSSHTLQVAKDAIKKSSSIWMAFNPQISQLMFWYNLLCFHQPPCELNIIMCDITWAVWSTVFQMGITSARI